MQCKTLVTIFCVFGGRRGGGGGGGGGGGRTCKAVVCTNARQRFERGPYVLFFPSAPHGPTWETGVLRTVFSRRKLCVNTAVFAFCPLRVLPLFITGKDTMVGVRYR